MGVCAKTMKKKNLAEAIFLFSCIEKLLRQHGGEGDSFSDLVKSFNKLFHTEESLKEDKQYADKIGYKFYYDGNSYHIKDQYEYEYDIEEELEKYGDIKKKWKEYLEYKRQLIGGLYNNLRTIGHERNQVMHRVDYTIKNFSRFKRACFQVIDYFEKGKSPWFIVKLHEKESIRKKLTTIALYEPMFWVKYSLTIPVIHELFRHYHFCTECSSFTYYSVIAGVSLFFFHLFFMFWGMITFFFKSEENMKIVLFLGLVGFMTYNYFSSSSKEQKHLYESGTMLSSSKYYYIRPKSLNIREKASSHARKIGVFRHNVKVCVSRTKGDWAYVKDKGWVSKRYLSKHKIVLKRKVVKKVPVSHKKDTKHSAKKKHKKVYVWHCIAKSKRASGWVEKSGKQNARSGALHQCKIRRVSNVPCKIVDCYKIH